MNNDLISRSALKEKAETVTLWNGEVRRLVSYETIDNAQTISPEQVMIRRRTMINISKDEIRDKMFFINEEDSDQPVAVIKVSDLLEKEVKKND